MKRIGTIAIIGALASGSVASAHRMNAWCLHWGGCARPQARAVPASSGLPSIYGATGGMELPDGSHHVQQGEGWVQRDPVVYLIFWGPQWSHDTSGIVAAEMQSFAELGHSSYGKILTQYGVHNDTRLAGAWIDDRPPSSHLLSINDLAREARRAVRVNHWTNGPYHQYVILPQPGTAMARFRKECGEHDAWTLGKHTYFVDLIPPYETQRFAACVYDYGAGDGTRPGTVVGATTSISTHEWAEAATDPIASTGESYGWADDTYNVEVADLCAWYSGTPTGMTVNVTYLWSNAAHGCVLS